MVMDRESEMYTHLVGPDFFYLQYEVKVGTFNVHGDGPNSSVVTIYSAEGSKSLKIPALFWPQREKICLRGVANNTGAGQPTHPPSLIGAFLIICLESTYVNLLQVEF